MDLETLRYGTRREGRCAIVIASNGLSAASQLDIYKLDTEEPMPTIPLKGGLTIRTFQAPPTDFDPAKATANELTLYGYPKCAAQFPDVTARWTAKLKKPGYKFIQPEFKERTPRNKTLPKFLGKAHGTQNFYNWAGAFVTPPAGAKFKWVESTWRFPQSYLPGGDQANIEYFASTWIGIDGDNSSGDIMQAGCDSDVFDQSGSPHQYNPWWEWFPAGSYWITNLTFSPGDTISMLICIAADSTNSAVVFFNNETKNTGAYFQAMAPAGTNLVGDSAEWIVEALTDDGFRLAKFDTVTFTDCNAGTVSGVTVQSGSGELIDMLGSNNAEIAQSTLIGSTEVQVKYTGP